MSELNKEELRRRAEAAAEVKPGRWHVHCDGLGPEFEPHPRQTFGVDDSSGCVVVWHGVGYNGIPYLQVAEHIAAANPAAVLSLLDENKRIANRLCACRDCGGQGEIYSGHNEYQGHFQPPEPVMDVCGTCGGDGVLGPLEDFESLSAERDQLRAEVEALRKDAERYRWLRGRLPGSPYRIAGVIYSEGGNSVDAVIDAAIAKEGNANG